MMIRKELVICMKMVVLVAMGVRMVVPACLISALAHVGLLGVFLLTFSLS
jgi:hypothetical protein